MSAQNSADTYYDSAIACFRIAFDSHDEQRKLVLLEMAQAWIELAHLAEKNSTTNLLYEVPPVPTFGSRASAE